MLGDDLTCDRKNVAVIFLASARIGFLDILITRYSVCVQIGTEPSAMSAVDNIGVSDMAAAIGGHAAKAGHTLKEQ
jgi:hypothetical protein